MAGRPKGAENKDKPFREMLRVALAENNWRALRSGVKRLIEAFEEGEPWAMQMIADRLDGKAIQGVEGKLEGGLNIQVIWPGLTSEKS
jgi:hypothetical protein